MSETIEAPEVDCLPCGGTGKRHGCVEHGAAFLAYSKVACRTVCLACLDPKLVDRYPGIAFGFTHEMVDLLRHRGGHEQNCTGPSPYLPDPVLKQMADTIEALLPPRKDDGEAET